MSSYRSYERYLRDETPEPNRPMSTTKKVVLGVSGLTVLVLGILWYQWARSFTSSIARFFEAKGFGILLVLVMVAALVWAGFAFFNENKARVVQGGVAVMALLGVLGFSIFYGYVNDYETAKGGYFESISYSEGALPDYEFRGPLPQAGNLLPRNQGDCFGSMQTTNYVIDEDSAKWTAVADGSSWNRPIGCVVTWDGTGQEQSDFEVCEFEGRTRAMNGTFWNNLNRLVQHEIPRGTWFNTQDVYGNCEDGKAVLYMPLLQNSGFIRTHDVPGGLLVVKSNDDVTYYDEVEPGQFPGPVYPGSLIGQQEDANRANAGLSQYRAGINGYEVAGGGGNADSLDPNIGNQSQFVLRNAETGRGEYVSPLTPVGTGQQIMAASRIEADHVKAGELNELEIIKFDTPRPANATTAQNIRSAYANTLPWANANLELLEITPGSNGDWYATIGRTLDLLYTVHIAEDGSSTLFNALNGEVIASADTNGNPTGGSAPAEPSEGGEAPTGDLGSMSTQDLITLRDQIEAVIDGRALAAVEPTE